jgi:hypothetical protein
MVWLKRLKLVDTQLTDDGLKELLSLRQLERLEISNSPITKQGLELLPQCESLTYFSLSGTRIRQEEFADFGKRHESTWDVGSTPYAGWGTLRRQTDTLQPEDRD